MAKGPRRSRSADGRIGDMSSAYPQNERVQTETSDTYMAYTAVTNNKIDKLTAALANITASLESLAATNHKLSAICDKLQSENARLTTENSALFYQIKRQANGNGDKKKTLLLGTSQIRNIDPSKMEETDVVCLRGASLEDMTAELQAVVDDTESPAYDRIVIIGGGNCCSQEDADMEALADQYEVLVALAKTAADHVTVCSIPPRTDKPHAAENIATLNACIPVICTTNEAEFINLHDMFYLSNGRINFGYLCEDNIHITRRAASEILQILNICVKRGSNGVSQKPRHTTPRIYRRKRDSESRPVHNAPRDRQNRDTAGRAMGRPSANHQNPAGRNNQPAPRNDYGKKQNRKPQQPPKHARTAPISRGDNRPSTSVPVRSSVTTSQRGEGRPSAPVRSSVTPRHESRPSVPVRSPAMPRQPWHHNGQQYGGADMTSDGDWTVVNRRRRHYKQANGFKDPHDNGTCSYCNEPNHREDTCSHGQYIVCDFCNGLGHKAKHHSP